MAKKNLVSTITLSLILAGCVTVGPDFSNPQVKTEDRWVSDLKMPTKEIPSSTEFWASFNDETLNKLIDLSVKNNPTLESAAQSVVQAQGALRIDQGNSRPSAALTASSQYQQPSLESQIRGQNGESVAQQFMGQASWEIDFWGKWRRTLEADRANLKMAEAALAAARVSLEASVASTYASVRMLEKRIEVAKANLVEQAENLRIAETRYRLGATSELDLRQSQTQFEQTNSQLPALQIALEQNQHALSILIGETPDYFVKNFPANQALPAIPDSLPIGAPNDLLRRRPDVLQAEYAAAAQSARIGVAKSALYPSFTLNGGVGYATTGSTNLFKWDSRAATYGVGFNLPLFDRGIMYENVKVQDSLFAQSVLAYQNQVLKAQQDVEDSLSGVSGNAKQLDALRRADKAAARTSALAQLQYRAGQVDYTTVTSAVQAHLQTSDAVVQTEGSLLQSYISTYRALGGGWKDSDSSNAIATNQ